MWNELNLDFDTYVGLMVWCQEDMHGTRWLWWILPLALVIVMVIVYTNSYTRNAKRARLIKLSIMRIFDEVETS